MCKERKRIKKAVRETIWLLRAMTEGQGSAGIEVFDTGAGGGFSHGSLFVDWLRDGRMCKIKVYSQEEFIDAIMKMLDEVHDGLIIKSFSRLRKMEDDW